VHTRVAVGGGGAKYGLGEVLNEYGACHDVAGMLG